jgi:hypothetical protein
MCPPLLLLPFDLPPPPLLPQLLKLSNAKDTILGDNLIRGVSGGERKRVTLGVWS